MSLCRLILEGMQLITQFRRYIKDWVNWIEIALYICSITFVCVFGVDCLCPLNWQWQIGVVAVFLGWMDLIVFISKFPLTGIYVLMFIKILTTFLKMIILSALLVFAFGLTFYLTFTQPEILVCWSGSNSLQFYVVIATMTAVSIFHPWTISFQDNYDDNWRVWSWFYLPSRPSWREWWCWRNSLSSNLLHVMDSVYYHHAHSTY